MATLARADLESLLRAHKLDRTLTSRPELPPAQGDCVIATDIPGLDARLGGGFPRGHLSEIVGPASSGRTGVVVSTLAAVTLRGGLVAFVDTLDTFDPPSALDAGLDLERLLWVRGVG